jgi:hypothetical protein
MQLTLEGHPVLPNATSQHVSRGIDALTSPEGPTFIVVSHSDASYCQAAGSDGRYVVEYRDVFGEGFAHYRACLALPETGAPATVFYRRRCSKHPPRRCPLRVTSSEVVGLDDVRRALVAFATTGERCSVTAWRDVTADFLTERRDEELSADIRTISVGHLVGHAVRRQLPQRLNSNHTV